MKIVNKEVREPIAGRETLKGEIYIFDGTGDPYFRHESGLCNMATGANQPIDSVVSGKRFMHVPHAELVIK